MGPLIVLTVTLAMVMAAGSLFAQDGQGDIESALARIDDMIDAEEPQRAMSELESMQSQASTPSVRGEILWRMASATLMHGDQRKDAGAGDNELLEIYARGEEYGKRAVEADPANPLGYYWQSANIGRWGQTKGVLNSLFRAPDMRDLLTETIRRDPDHAESYYVLGQLYAKVPGMISFGNVEYAVSLARKSVDLMEAELTSGEREERNEAFYVQLASHLADRDWNRRRRDRERDSMRESYNGAKGALEKGFYYEGIADIPGRDDEAEAREILEEVIRRLERTASPTPSERRQLTEARELLSEL